jgi:broad specificity phosphatase PhoE
MIIEDGFTEEDERWTGSVETGETKDDVTKRAKRFLDRVFDRDVETCE